MSGTALETRPDQNMAQAMTPGQYPESGVRTFQKNVDIVLGSQYGDEGKGMVAKLMADKAEAEGNPYVWTARVGAQNAEHRFIHKGCPHTGRVLPSACCYRDDIIAVLGAGHCFIPEHLIREATHMGIGPDRIFVDGNAMWLRENHASDNLEIGNARGTTGWGIGQAVAEKVRRKPGTKLIRDAEILQEWLGDHMCNIPAFLDSINGSGLFEGSQGCMLSLDHGHYPFCTAKNVTVPSMCGELGIGTKRVNRVFGCVRLVLMRVSGPSGPVAAEELTYDQVEARCNLRLPHHGRLQGDSSRWNASHKGEKAEEERLFELSMNELLQSHRLNNYDALAVTFADYHREGNYRVTSWGDLHADTRAAIEDMERTIAPVILIRTGPGEHDNIWRN